MSHANSKVTQMENKSTTQDVKNQKGIAEFGRDIKEELRKVEWTSKQELIAYTKIVVVSMFLFGTAIYFIDLIIQGALSGINMLFKVFTG